MELYKMICDVPKNEVIGNNLIKAHSILNREYNRILCSVSGGADSDIMIDIVLKCLDKNKIDFVWFDTGIEYDATKRHLEYLEQKYNIEIERVRAIKPIPATCKEYGQPFIGKQVSQFLEGLQRHDFKWEDKPYEELILEYPEISSYLKWWCNSKQIGTNVRFCIAQNKWLKEFLIENPPTFKISSRCCNYAKKNVSKKLIRDRGYDLQILGIRKSEGGLRATSYKSCFDDAHGIKTYMPLFWYNNDTKECYENYYDIKHSDCYEVYGLKRTGCAGCPFGGDMEQKLEVMEKYEPKLYKACCNIFGDTYAYTRAYNEFVKKKNAELKQKKLQGK